VRAVWFRNSIVPYATDACRAQAIAYYTNINFENFHEPPTYDHTLPIPALIARAINSIGQFQAVDLEQAVKYHPTCSSFPLFQGGSSLNPETDKYKYVGIHLYGGHVMPTGHPIPSQSPFVPI
jgi:hypothetical protein